MLAKARIKYPAEISWMLGRAETLPFEDGAFDACLASQVVHHLHDKRQAFTEMSRVLRPSGRIGVRSSSHAQLETILDYRFFPSAIQIERERLPDISVIKSLMLGVGFSSVAEQSIRQELFNSTDDYLEKLQNRYASVLTLISDEEYQAGLAKATAYLKNGDLKSRDRFAEITFLVGIK
jgi:ubiquinone/menaquinone biosynthesis C-methylase UbiE